MSQATPDAAPDISQVLGLERQTSRRRRWLYWVGALVLLVLAAAAGLAFLPGNEGHEQFKTAEAIRGDLRVRVTATGELAPVNQVEVGTEVSGTIESVAVDFNDRVSTGDVLASLDRDQLQARLRQSEALLALAEARVLEAQATLTETANRLRRTKDLIAKRLSSQEELDTVSAAHARAQALLEVGKAQVAQAQAQLDADRRTLEKAIIRAPIDGIVLKRQVEPGQTVAASLQTPVLFTLAENLAQMELQVDVDEADVGQVAAGQRAEFTVDAYPNRTFPAEIKQVRFAPATVEGVVTYKTLLVVDNADLLLRPGMTATAEIVVGERQDVLLVPNAALRFTPPRPAGFNKQPSEGLVGMLLPRRPKEERRPADGGGKGAQVWVLRDGQPVAIPIKTGATDGTVTQVLEGAVEPGMALLTDTVAPGR